MTENAHNCPACPGEFRDLYAVAHNAVVNYGRGRERKTMAALKEAVERYRPVVDAHFEETREAGEHGA